ncbi:MULTISPECIES: MobA/MobL family protein [Agrobacterium]|nr:MULTISPECIES: MobA/MobL family protein [Agrobacterium]
MDHEREARTVDYIRHDLLHEAFATPGNAPQWLKEIAADRSRWQRSRKPSGTGSRCSNIDPMRSSQGTFALPRELSPQQNIALVSAFVEQHLTTRGMIAGWVLHDAPGNPHVHLMTTLRPPKHFLTRLDEGLPPKPRWL